MKRTYKYINTSLYLYVIAIMILTLTKNISLFINNCFAKLGLIEFHATKWGNNLTVKPFIIEYGLFKYYIYNAVGNFFLFFPLGGLLFLRLARTKKHPAIFSFFACTLFSLSIELLQYHVIGRDGDVNDLIYNSTGALFGIILTSVIYKNRNLG